ncbi:kasugamycin N-acetyltransferase AAC(2')-IIb [Paenibacillus sp. H1-7]|uniref:kasugamycin N-acetyltransferase AAC(2')-IIb n=1 Tax=Paenibacillus sp. H1-7 TaxID=2282849 RepID=UPI001EF91042|nr:kasugamycin N-acetyltransferase AAC(2')-IIb [Paenibacillus sp. H1-7]ULL16065.1 kasugamycin N-acetyltransferase AAC(2')-IIb [Paenibacillus sp. H1-7]
MNTNKKELIPTARQLMELHVNALFTHDQSMRLRAINEPWPGEAEAPRFFLGRTTEGTALCRFRHDVPEQLVEQLEGLCSDERIAADIEAKPKHLEDYMNLLQGERFTMGPCFLIPAYAEPTMQVVGLTRETIADYVLGDLQWLEEEIDYVQPCVALVLDGAVVSVCRSVRITSEAHEAGLETVERFRGNGYAQEVVAGWAMAVRQAGCLPLYSTSWDNHASRSVAGKLALSFYGSNFTIY